MPLSLWRGRRPDADSGNVVLKQFVAVVVVSVAFVGYALAEPLYVPLPVFVDKALAFSNRGYLVASGKKFDVPIGSFLAASGSEYQTLRVAIAALQQGDIRGFSSVASPEAFTRTSQGMGGYFARFHATWITLRDKRLHAVLRFGEIELAVFSAVHGQLKVFPLLVFRYDDSDSPLVVPGDGGVMYNVLVMWSAGLTYPGSSLLPKKEFDRQSVGSRIFSIHLDLNDANVPEFRRKTLVLLSDEKVDRGVAGTTYSLLSSLRFDTRRSVEQTRSPDVLTMLPKYYSPDSAGYLRTLSAEDAAQYREQVVDSTPIGWINLGAVQAVMMKHERTGLIGLRYVAQIDGHVRVVNVGRASPIDSFLLSRSLIDSAVALATALGR